MRAAYLALLLGVIGGLSLASAVLTDLRPGPVTVATALGLESGPALDARRASAVAVLTARCMRSAGLAWAPDPEPPPALPDADLPPIAWADRWGLGVSTMLDRPVPSPIADPDIGALAGLPADAQARARDALVGTAGRPGCADQANDAVYRLRDRALEPLRADLAELDRAIAADPAAVGALAAWRGCVVSVSLGLPLDRASLPGALAGRFAERAAASASSPAGIATIQADERRTAGVLARCDETFVDARARAAAPHEAAFIVRERARLDAIGAAIRAAEAALPTLPP